MNKNINGKNEDDAIDSDFYCCAISGNARNYVSRTVRTEFLE